MPKFQPSEGATYHKVKVHRGIEVIQMDVWVASLVRPFWSDEQVENYLLRCVHTQMGEDSRDQVEFYHDL